VSSPTRPPPSEPRAINPSAFSATRTMCFTRIDYLDEHTAAGQLRRTPGRSEGEHNRRRPRRNLVRAQQDTRQVLALPQGPFAQPAHLRESRARSYRIPSKIEHTERTRTPQS